jgi:biotin operon repressor
MRLEIGKGRWSGSMPGRDELAKVLGVSGKTVEAALQQLQSEGLLVSQGPGRRRLIVFSEDTPTPSLRVAILTYEPLALTDGYLVAMQHLLIEAGHSAFFTSKSLGELGFDVKKISQFVKKTKADAWVMVSAPQGVLEWFAAQAIPAFTLFGRRRGLAIAGTGPEKSHAMIAATRQLIGLGHRRIVLLTRKARRLPKPGTSEMAFLDELAANGIPPSPYNLPDWEETVEGFHQVLKSLFQVTPPTALIIDESQFYLAALQFCASIRLRVPEEISLISTDDDKHFAWFTPAVSHISWERKSVMRRVERWAANVSRGKDNRRQTFTKAVFVEGGTIGPVRSGEYRQERSLSERLH